MNQVLKRLINTVNAAKAKAAAEVQSVESAYLPRIQLYVHTNLHPLIVGAAIGLVLALIFKVA